MVRQWLLSVFGPSSRFVEGDTVQLVAGQRELMVVGKVVLNGKSTEPQLLCRWTDSHTNEFCERLFAESEVEPFDWNRPMETRPTGLHELNSLERPESLVTSHPWENLFGIDTTDGLSRLNNNKAVYEKLLVKFLNSHRHFVGELSSKMNNGKGVEAKRMLHTFKGLAGTLGMHRLEGVARELEGQLSLQANETSPLLSVLSLELENVLKSIGDTIQANEGVAFIPSKVNVVSSLKELEQSLVEHSPAAISQWEQIGTINGHENEGETLGQAIVTYEFEKALTLLRTIQSKVEEQGEIGVGKP